MCYDFERLDEFRRELDKLDALKKQQDPARAPAKPAAPEKGEQEQPVPA